MTSNAPHMRMGSPFSHNTSGSEEGRRAIFAENHVRRVARQVRTRTKISANIFNGREAYTTGIG